MIVNFIVVWSSESCKCIWTAIEEALSVPLALNVKSADVPTQLPKPKKLTNLVSFVVAPAPWTARGFGRGFT